MTHQTRWLSSATKFCLVAASTFVLSGCLAIMPAIAPKAKNVEEGISTDFPYRSQFVDVNGSRMHYVERGEGRPILLVHGNPTSSYLWRNVIPEIEGDGRRIIAVDLIGMGKSEKPDIAYRFEDHAAYLEGFIEELGLEDMILVLHDWGGGLGLDYAARHPENIRGIAFMEAVMKPMSLSEADFGARYIFSRLRDPEDNHELLIEGNFFVETLLPMMTGRRLSEEEMDAYRAPFMTPRDRLPVAQWPLEIPLDGEPARNVRRIGANYDWLKAADVPILLLYGEPGMIMRPNVRAGIEEDLPRMTTVSIGSGLHYLQEVQPTKIGRELDAWIATLEGAESS